MGKNVDKSAYTIHGETVIRVGWHLPKWQNLRDLHKDQRNVYLVLVKDLMEDKNLSDAIISAETGNKASIKSLNNLIFSIGEKAGKNIAFKVIENGNNIVQEINDIKAMLDGKKFTPLKQCL